MKLIVGINNIKLDKNDTLNSGEYNVHDIEFEFDEVYEGLVKKAVFSTLDHTYQVSIIDNTCTMPYEVLASENNVKIGVYAYEVDGDDLVLRYSPKPITKYVNEGSYKEHYDNWEELTPTDKEQMEQMLNNINIDGVKEGKITTITITYKDGTSKELTLEDGMGLDYNWSGTSLGVKREDETEYQYTDLKGDKGEPGAIKFEIVQQLPIQDIHEDTIYLVPYAIITVQELPSTGVAHTIYIVSSTNKRYVYESNQWIEISSDNRYIEYIYVDNQWEELGGINVDVDLSDYYTKQETNTLVNAKYTKPNDGIPKTDLNSLVQASLDKADTSIQSEDLTDYVKNTDYATSSKGGVIKVNDYFNVGLSQAGALLGIVKTYAQYTSGDNSGIISKGTLENVITGKGLVSNTDYASGETGGVVKTHSNYAISTVNGYLVGLTKTYAQYQTMDNYALIGKGTLENVLTEKIGNIQTLLDNLNTGGGVE